MSKLRQITQFVVCKGTPIVPQNCTLQCATSAVIWFGSDISDYQITIKVNVASLSNEGEIYEKYFYKKYPNKKKFEKVALNMF